MVGGSRPPYFDVMNPHNVQRRCALPPTRKLPRRLLITATIPLAALAVGGVADGEGGSSR